MKFDDFLLLTDNLLLENDNKENFLCEASTIAWGRKGNKIVRKFRCPFGKRKGRLVSNMGQCSKPIDIKKRMSLKKTKAKFGGRIARKAKKTKRFNPVSKRIAKLNKPFRRK